MSVLRCPICGKAFDPEQSSGMPFCSRRCRTIDLRRWLDEQYSLAAEPEEEPEAPEDGDSAS